MVKGHDTTIASLDNVDKKKPDGWLELCHPKRPNDFNSDDDIHTVEKLLASHSTDRTWQDTTKLFGAISNNTLGRAGINDCQPSQHFSLATAPCLGTMCCYSNVPANTDPATIHENEKRTLTFRGHLAQVARPHNAGLGWGSHHDFFEHQLADRKLDGSPIFGLADGTTSFVTKRRLQTDEDPYDEELRPYTLKEKFSNKAVRQSQLEKKKGRSLASQGSWTRGPGKQGGSGERTTR
ncbi:hypothetical protein SUNI508_12923 [Seiridium unicorne]|uniref:Uncharacterized protein n=1 Tax=Seiridium unicorne TaxID=138068 RepID=A0ABR2VF46_9PEZI